MKPFFCFFALFFSSFLYSQQTEFVDFKSAKAIIDIDPFEKEVSGNIRYSFSVLKNIDSIFIDAREMTFDEIKLDDHTVTYKYLNNKLWLYKKFKTGKSYNLKLNYRAIPKKAMYFIGWEYSKTKKQVWTQGQGKYTSHWLPSFDDMNEKVIFDLTILFQDGYEVIANGKLVNTEQLASKKKWQYDMQEPMSSYLLALAIGNYKKKVVFSNSKIPLELYYYPEDSLKLEPTYRYSKKIFDFLESEIGVLYPWQNYKQIPVKDFLYAGMENTSATIFSDSYVIDSTSFIDKNYVNVNAHELAHQWFGDLITEKSGLHHWLQEGFATYYALLAEREVFGDDYFYWKLYQTSEQLTELSDSTGGESLLNPKASSLTFYEKGAWALYVLHHKIGDVNFKKTIKAYLEKFRFKNVITNNFIKIAEQISEQDLNSFVELWLKQKKFPQEIASELLSKSEFITNFTKLKNRTLELPLKIDQAYFSNKDIYYPIKDAWINKLKIYSKNISEKHYKDAFKSNNVKVRQALALSIDTISELFKKDFESLLKDKSYITIENALLKLWLQFPKDRKNFLDKTARIQGFNDKNVRLLWLTLALATPEYDSKNTPVYYRELSSYTSRKNHFEIRQNAFQYLYQLQALTNNNLKDLIIACQHPVWQFSKFSKQLLNRLLKESVYMERYKAIFSELSEKNQTFLKKQIVIKKQ